LYLISEKIKRSLNSGLYAFVRAFGCTSVNMCLRTKNSWTKKTYYKETFYYQYAFSKSLQFLRWL